MMMTMMITVVMYGTWDGKGVLWLKTVALRLIHQPLVSSGWLWLARPDKTEKQLKPLNQSASWAPCHQQRIKANQAYTSGISTHGHT